MTRFAPGPRKQVGLGERNLRLKSRTRLTQRLTEPAAQSADYVSACAQNQNLLASLWIINVKTFEEIHEAQAKLLYGLIVAGKSANFADRALKAFLESGRITFRGDANYRVLPFRLLNELSSQEIDRCLRKARTGNYGKLSRAFDQIGVKRHSLDMFTVRPADLELIHGVGPKTSRFVIMWIRPEEKYAALDVHVLRWLREKRGYAAPRSTPQSPALYAAWEIVFLQEANTLKLTPRELDLEIWEAGAGRTQKTTSGK